MSTIDAIVARHFRKLGTKGRWPASSEETTESMVRTLLSGAPLNPETRTYAAACVDGWRQLVWMPMRERNKLISALRKAEVDAAIAAIKDMVTERARSIPPSREVD